MKPLSSILVLVAVHVQALCSEAHQQSPFTDAPPPPHRDSSETWSNKYGAQYDLMFSGPLAFSHLHYARCLNDDSPTFDIALLGMPFDTTVTYRPGARFGPTGIRIGSRRIGAAWSLSWGLDPYQQGLEIIDCGDVSIAPARWLHAPTQTAMFLWAFSD
jgi:agmatinase